jgi:hypothetical protein
MESVANLGDVVNPAHVERGGFVQKFLCIKAISLFFLLWLKLGQRLGQEFLVQIRPARVEIRPVGSTFQRPLKQVRIEPEQPMHLMKSQPVQAELSLDVAACE